MSSSGPSLRRATLDTAWTTSPSFSFSTNKSSCLEATGIIQFQYLFLSKSNADTGSAERLWAKVWTEQIFWSSASSRALSAWKNSAGCSWHDLSSCAFLHSRPLKNLLWLGDTKIKLKVAKCLNSDFLERAQCTSYGVMGPQCLRFLHNAPMSGISQSIKNVQFWTCSSFSWSGEKVGSLFLLPVLSRFCKCTLLYTFLLYSWIFFLSFDFVPSSFCLHSVFLPPTFRLPFVCVLSSFRQRSGFLPSTFCLPSVYVLSSFRLPSIYVLSSFRLRSV